jgi:hypothetical protein
MGRTVALIIGAAYSGSSLLTLLLDAQRGIRGLGEAVNLITGNDMAHCVVCAKPVRECPLHAIVDRSRFYGSLFDYYGDCEVLIDSSKSVQGCLGIHPFERDLDYRVLLLSKAPHEFAWSYLHHQEGQTSESAFRLYLDFYREQIGLLFRQGWFRPWRCLRLSYRQLATNTESLLRQLVQFLHGDTEPVETAWRTDTHIIGGNWMVAAQLQGQQRLFTENSRYLQGKYGGEYHTIFYDNQWQSDKEYLEICLQLYQSHKQELQDTLRNVGQADVTQQINDLQRAIVAHSAIEHHRS